MFYVFTFKLLNFLHELQDVLVFHSIEPVPLEVIPLVVEQLLASDK